MFKSGVKAGTPRILAGILKAQKNIQKLKEDMATQEVSVSVAGVDVTMTCAHVIKRMTIAPKLLTEPPELIADVIASAVNAASREAEKVVEAQAGSISALFTSKK
jgi:hypothetical protein